MLFHELGLGRLLVDTYASEGGTSVCLPLTEMIKRLNAKILRRSQEIRGQMDTRRRMRPQVAGLHQYMETMNGPADFLEAPVSPITGTVFENPRAPKWFT